MPKLTNIHGLPQPLVNAVAFSTYSKGGADFSVSELCKPPRITALEILHDSEIEEDASDRLWLLMGSAGHEVLRRSSNGGIVEERCEIELDGVKISGQVDYAVADKAIWDYKFISLWAIKDGVKIEHEQQINSYRFLASQYGVEVNELKIIAILRDWSKAEASRDKSYPQSQVAVLPVRMWPDDEIRNWLRGRIKLHQAARAGNLPECTAEEMWEKPEKFAVIKKGNQRATKVHETAGAAIAHVASMGAGYEIEKRRAERPRCENYCSVSEKCSQYQQWKGQNESR